MQTRLLIACEDVSRGAGLGRRLSAEAAPAMEISTTDLHRLPAQVAFVQPDVLLIEYASLGVQAQSTVPSLLRQPCAPRLLFLCDACPRELMLAFVRLGARGCVFHCDPPALVAKAVRSIHAGEIWFARASLMRAVRSLVGTPVVVPPRVDVGPLTPREEEILDLIAGGLTNKEIGRQLDISDQTVKTHLHRVYVKLQQSGRYKALLSQPGRLAH